MNPSVTFPADVTRRRFLGDALGVAAVGSLLGARLARAEAAPAADATPPAPPITRRFKVGIVGCGGRAEFVAKYLREHGGFVIHAVADYFPDAADRLGTAHGVDAGRRFSGLSGYQRLIESDVEIVVIEHVPYFYPETAAAAVAAGKHVYMAKPVAVDVPGTLRIGEAGRAATRANLCFMVDYQMPNDPSNIEVRRRIHEGALGTLAHLTTHAFCPRWGEPDAQTPVAEYLRGGRWLFHNELGASPCVSFDIHAIDAAIWALGRRPVEAMGYAATHRPNAFLNGPDVVQVVMRCEDNLIWTHQHQALSNQCMIAGVSGLDWNLVVHVQGTSASAVIPYYNRALIRGGAQSFAGPVESLYDAGVVRNIARYYRDLTEGHVENPTVERAVDGTLTAILAREAAMRQTRLTMEELLKENKKLEFDTSGLKA